jgi:hypothetical protein
MPRPIPSARALVSEALKEDPNLDVNSLHQRTYDLMINYRSRYYESKVDAFLSRLSFLDLNKDIK